MQKTQSALSTLPNLLLDAVEFGFFTRQEAYGSDAAAAFRRARKCAVRKAYEQPSGEFVLACLLPILKAALRSSRTGKRRLLLLAFQERPGKTDCTYSSGCAVVFG